MLLLCVYTFTHIYTIASEKPDAYSVKWRILAHYDRSTSFAVIEIGTNR